MSEEEFRDLTSLMQRTEQAFLNQTENVRRLLEIYGTSKEKSILSGLK